MRAKRCISTITQVESMALLSCPVTVFPPVRTSLFSKNHQASGVDMNLIAPPR